MRNQFTDSTFPKISGFEKKLPKAGQIWVPNQLGAHFTNHGEVGGKQKRRCEAILGEKGVLEQTNYRRAAVVDDRPKRN